MSQSLGTDLLAHSYFLIKNFQSQSIRRYSLANSDPNLGRSYRFIILIIVIFQ